MSLLSKLTPQHPGSALAIRIAGFGAPDTPTVAPPGGSSASGDAGHPLVDATTLTQLLLMDRHDDSALAQLEARVDEYVHLWAPALHTTSRFELVSALLSIDDAITEIVVRFMDVIHSGSTAFVVWVATGRFSRATFLDDDRLIEPSGAVVRVAGATRMSFTAGLRAQRISCYYDRLSIVEQMLALGPPRERS